MVMSASNFFRRFKKLKAFIGGGHASAELKAAAAQVTAAFKASYSSEAFKSALAADADIPQDLEEKATTAVMLLNQERAKEFAGG